MSRAQWARPILPLSYIATLFALSSIPGDVASETPIAIAFQLLGSGWQNLLHIPLYTGLVLCCYWALPGYTRSFRKRLVLAALVAMLWGLLDELHQASVPGRYGSLTDIALNFLGVALGLGMVFVYQRPARTIQETGI